MKKIGRLFTYIGTTLLLLCASLYSQAATLALSQTVFQPNAPITATFSSGPGNASDWIGIYPQGITPSGSPQSLLWRYTNGTTSAGGALTNGAVTFSNQLTQGQYSAWFLANNGYSVLAGPVNFSVSANSTPQLTLDRTTYNATNTITANFSNGPGNTSDWIGIYPRNVIPNGNPASLLWRYTNGTTSSGGNLKNGAVSFSNHGLGSGLYTAWFLANNGYTALASFNFAVNNGDSLSWILNNFSAIHAVAGTAYSANIRAWAKNTGGTLIFSKVAGPGWLNIASNGMISGTPGSGNIGSNAFTVRVADTGTGQAANATLTISVFGAGSENVLQINLMTYNTWHAWGSVNNGFQKGIESVVRSNADIIGLQESSTAQAQQIAQTLGWHYSNNAQGSTQIVSRYPIVESSQTGKAAKARIRLSSNPLKEIVVYNVHLDYQYYGPYAAQRAGATESSVLAEENRSLRLPQIQAVLSAMNSDLGNANVRPVFLTGDFNVPSHLDWTSATASSHYNVGYVGWPTSVTVANAGLTDSFRVAYPNPVSVPGNTWSSIHKGSEPQDRIDRIYYKSPTARVNSASVFTTPVEVVIGPWGSSTTPIRNNTWPSDHAAVIVSYDLN